VAAVAAAPVAAVAAVPVAAVKAKPLSPYDYAPLVPTAGSWGARPTRRLSRKHLRLKRATR
jgi:hypothetical protein